MDRFTQIESLKLGQSISIRAEWRAQETYIQTKGHMLFKKYIIVAANDLILQDERKKNQIVASKLRFENQHYVYTLEIDNGASPFIDVDSNDFLGCIQFAEKRINNRTTQRGIVRFLNLTQLFSIQKLQNINVSAISPKQQIIQGSPNKGQKFNQKSLNEFSNSVQYSKFSSPLNLSSNILDLLKVQDQEEEKPMMPNFGKNKQIKIQEPLNIPPVALKLPKNVFSWDKTTPYVKKFLIEEQKVSRIAFHEGRSYQIVSEQTIPKNAITDITFRLHQYGDQYSYSPIAFGIITQSRKNSQFSNGRCRQSVGYRTDPRIQSGWISIDRNKVQNWIGDAFVVANGTLLMSVDTINYQISFINSSRPNQEFKRQFQLEKNHWKSKEIYAYVEFSHKGPSVSIICDS